MRGSIQLSLLVLTRFPYYHIFHHLFHAVIERIFLEMSADRDVTTVLSLLYTALNDPHAIQYDGAHPIFAFRLFSSSLSQPLTSSQILYFPRPHMKYDTDYTGVTISDLIRTLRSDAMILWYAVLMQMRILFSGCQVYAREVGSFSLAAAILVHPISSFARNVHPYVSITDPSPLYKPSYICGMTNPIFEDKGELWDVRYSFGRENERGRGAEKGKKTTGGFVCNQPRIKPTSADKVCHYLI